MWRIVLFSLAAPLLASDLHVAARAGDALQVAELLAKGANPNDRDGLGGTPLHDAAWGGHKAVVELLIKGGADVNIRHKEGGSTPLHYAVITNRLEIVELLLEKGADVKTRYGQGSTVLHLAANRGYKDLAGYLMDHGAPINERDDVGATPLEEAVWKGQTDLVKMLLHRKAIANGELIHIAARRGHADVLALLLDGGARADLLSKDGATPLDEALRYRQVAVAKVLLERKDVTLNPVRIEELVLEGRTELVEVLLDHGAQATATTRLGSTLLHDAALKGNAPMVELLLRKGAQVDARNVSSGGTALHDAALAGQQDVVSLLLAHGAVIDLPDLESGNTALANAASWGRTNLVSLLLEKGANRKLKNKAGKTPFVLAKENGHLETAERLQ